MKKTFALTIALLAAAVSVVAQEEPRADCPTISVTGPAGVWLPGETIWFTTELKGTSPKNISFQWSVDKGEIVNGQGTKDIQVRSPSDTEPRLTATVSVIGFAEGCRAKASDTAFTIIDPGPIKVGTIRSAAAGDYERELAKFAQELKDSPNSQGYVWFGNRKDTAQQEIESMERFVLGFLVNKEKIDRSRITTGRVYEGAEIVELWRVPPGVDNPVCQECAKSPCPTLSVLGPPGIWLPGEVISYSASLEGPIRPNIIYRWSVSDGEIVDGQGTRQIRVTQKPTSQASLTASIEILGFPKKCPNISSETSSVAIDYRTTLIDELPNTKGIAVPRQLSKTDLRTVIDGPFRIYLILGSPKTPKISEVRNQSKQLKNFLVQSRKVPADRIFFGVRRLEKPLIQVYFVPFIDDPPDDIELIKIEPNN